MSAVRLPRLCRMAIGPWSLRTSYKRAITTCCSSAVSFRSIITRIRSRRLSPTALPCRHGKRFVDGELSSRALAAGFWRVFQRTHQKAATRLGRQELEAELLEDTPGALWSHGSILLLGRADR